MESTGDSPEPLSREEEAERCRGLPDVRAQMRARAKREFSVETATRLNTCLAKMTARCESCEANVCVLRVLESVGASLPNEQVPACDRMRRTDPERADLCRQFAAGMNARGRSRFSACMQSHPAFGARFCLWDPASTPCTEGADPLL